MYLGAVIQRLREQGHDFSEFKPCTEQEIRALEQELGVQLPAAYREFLLLMGHDGGDVLSGTRCFYADLTRIQDWSRTLLTSNHVATPLPADAFIFLYTGYQFLFFRTTEGADPPVYSYTEGDAPAAAFPQTFPHFSHFLRSVIEE